MVRHGKIDVPWDTNIPTLVNETAIATVILTWMDQHPAELYYGFTINEIFFTHAYSGIYDLYFVPEYSSYTDAEIKNNIKHGASLLQEYPAFASALCIAADVSTMEDLKAHFLGNPSASDSEFAYAVSVVAYRLYLLIQYGYDGSIQNLADVKEFQAQRYDSANMYLNLSRLRNKGYSVLIDNSYSFLLLDDRYSSSDTRYKPLSDGIYTFKFIPPPWLPTECRLSFAGNGVFEWIVDWIGNTGNKTIEPYYP